MAKTFALSLPDRPKDVAIWCEPMGKFHFYCLNGNWEGDFYPDKNVVVVLNGRGHGAIKVWEGEVPRSRASDYNDAINWIKEQLNAREDT